MCKSHILALLGRGRRAWMTRASARVAAGVRDWLKVPFGGTCCLNSAKPNSLGPAVGNLLSLTLHLPLYMCLYSTQI